MSERTFNPSSADIDLATDATCQDCGKKRWEHRDGGMVYGLVCPTRSTPAEPLDEERLARAITLHREQSSAKAQGCDHNCAPGIREMYARLSRNEEGGSFYGDQQDDPHQPDGEANR